MARNRKVEGGFPGIARFLLSPLSWWNDAFINLPLALGFGWLVARFNPAPFEPAVIVGCWLTSALGLVLTHQGAIRILCDGPASYTRRMLAGDLVLRPIENYFPEKPRPAVQIEQGQS